MTLPYAGVPGVPETVLSHALLATLPQSIERAPWTCRCDAAVWLARGGRAAGEALAPALRGGARATGVLGAMVRYHETPVGPYDEVLGLVVSHSRSRVWGSVAFMAVDSLDSMAGGRANWSVPKTLATFDGGVAGGEHGTARGADRPRWEVSVFSRAVGPAVPVVMAGSVRQAFFDGRVGTSRLRARGRGRAALVTVGVDSEGPLASWLRPGRHLGAVAEDVRFTLGAPAFPSP